MTGPSVQQPAVGPSEVTMGGAIVGHTVPHRTDDGPPTQPLDLSEMFRRDAEGRGDR